MLRFRHIIIFGLLALPAQAQTIDPGTLDKLTREQEAAKIKAQELGNKHKALQSDISGLKKDLVVTAAEAETYEKERRNVEARLVALSQTRTDLKVALYADRDSLTQLLAALQQVETRPPPLIFGQVQNTLDVIQSTKLMSGLSSSLSARANRLATQLRELENVSKNIESEKTKLTAAESVLNRKQTKIRSLVATKSKLEKQVWTESEAQRKRADKLASEASSLRDLIAKFEKSARDIAPRVKPEPDTAIRRVSRPRLKPRAGRAPQPLQMPPDTKRFADARGRLRAPVAGTLRKSYSKATPGLTVTTSPNAQVIAPYTGRVEFSGPFKNYDNVVILNVGDGYFILLTGLGDLYAETGNLVEMGEPIGLMPAASDKNAGLYIEFRKNGTPVNPKPWLGTAFARSG